MLRGTTFRAGCAALAGLAVAAAMLSGCEAPKAVTIGPAIAVSPDGTLLAFEMGANPALHKGKTPAGQDRMVYLTRSMEPGAKLAVAPDSNDPRAVAWYPSANSDELVIATGLLGRRQGLLSVSASSGAASPATQAVPAEAAAPATQPAREPTAQAVLALQWSPKGKMLALALARGKECQLAFSDNGGKTVKTTDILMSGDSMAWTDEQTLYVVQKDAIEEISFAGNQPSAARTFAKGRELMLVGAMDGKPLYVADEKKIFWGEHQVYGAAKKIETVIVDGSLLAIATGRRVHVVHMDGAFKADRILPKRARLVGFSARAGQVYVLRGETLIERYGLNDTAPVVEVYSIGP